jgi:hypothetical protein
MLLDPAKGVARSYQIGNLPMTVLTIARHRATCCATTATRATRLPRGAGALNE